MGCLLGVTSNGNTALHLAASRGHSELAALVCERAPSLVATRNGGLDTPLHCAAKAGSRDVAACLLSLMRAAAAGGADEAAEIAIYDQSIGDKLPMLKADMAQEILNREPIDVALTLFNMQTEPNQRKKQQLLTKSMTC
nr:ankyrin repeat domain-containing protein 65-like [Setaria viridis]